MIIVPDASLHVCALPDPLSVPAGSISPCLAVVPCKISYRLNPAVLLWFRVSATEAEQEGGTR